MASEWRGSLTQNRRKKNDLLFLRDSRWYRGHGIFHPVVALLISETVFGTVVELLSSQVEENSEIKGCTLLL